MLIQSQPNLYNECSILHECVAEGRGLVVGRWGLRTEGPRIESRQVPGDFVGVFSSKIVIPVKNPKRGLGLW